ncbi:MAG: MFS transporter small subunit [Candidatus Angelobacter sp.]|jgi:hypothetical protein
MDQIKKTPVALVALAWLLVGIPWGWGVTELWKNARKLFQSPPAATAPANTAPAAPAAPAASPAAPAK